MSLRQDVLRSYTADTLERRLERASISQRRPAHDDKDDSGDEVVNVVSLPNSPGGTRPSSPTRNSSRPVKGPLLLSSAQRDPLRRLPTEISQRIFSQLSTPDLVVCSRVSKKWNRSQTLNYVWFQYYRKENFHDESLPPGKWTKRESKQNWRTVYGKTVKEREPTTFSRASKQTSPLQSGQQTPRERKEEQWKQEAQASSRPGKVEMREMYKEMGGRKSRGKTKLGAATGATRDKGGWNEGEDW
ncbi:hypothetical protein FA15DRAFT_675031 [Coprinopsis marcescibilis]|uniref:F-box domain-containing protein n=1 Tax=Coprinopsis marcescibilis TaxID=230819 RepID=A0A5C3KSQ1_COPMA|nr:hypothetical protein FA15DRAFT_675031 [Coprinopsis marcescibilis]